MLSTIILHGQIRPYHIDQHHGLRYYTPSPWPAHNQRNLQSVPNRSPNQPATYYLCDILICRRNLDHSHKIQTHKFTQLSPPQFQQTNYKNKTYLFKKINLIILKFSKVTVKVDQKPISNKQTSKQIKAPWPICISAQNNNFINLSMIIILSKGELL